MSDSVAEAIQPTYEQIVGGIRHKGVQELLQGAEALQLRVNQELAAIEANEDLIPEAKERKAQEVLDRHGPKIAEAYKRSKATVSTSAESSYHFSLPFPEGKTFAQARVQDSTEMLAVQSEADAISQRVVGQSLQEATKAVSKNPRDKGIRQGSGHTTKALRQEFDKAMSEGGIEGRVRAMAIERVCESLGAGAERSSPSYIVQQSRILDSATRRYLAAMRELARVRKLQANTPAVQQNVQINLDNGR